MHSSVYYWVKGQNVHVVNSHQLIFGAVKNLFAVWSSAEAAKMSQNFLTLVGLRCYGRDHPLYT